MNRVKGTTLKKSSGGKRLVIALTGGIGSGKTELARKLAALGAVAINADVISRQLREGRLKKQISAAFPEAVACGQIDKRLLRAEILSDAQKRKRLEGIIHPEVHKEIKGIIKKTTGIIIIELPILFESGMSYDFDKILTISASEEQRRVRAFLRDGMTNEEFDLVSRAQLTDIERESLADIVIKNDEGIDKLNLIAEELYKKWQEEYLN